MVPRLPGSCSPRGYDGANLQALENIFEREMFEAQRAATPCGDSLGRGCRIICRAAGGFRPGLDLRQQALGALLRGLAKEYGTETQAAADGLFENAQGPRWHSLPLR